jgi:hypothetical protein
MKTLGSWIAGLTVSAIIIFVMKVSVGKETISSQRDGCDCGHRTNYGVQLMTNPIHRWHPSNVYHRR